MKVFLRILTLVAVVLATGCASYSPPIQVISKECLWARQFQWTMEQGDALIDCCPNMARSLLKYNKMVEEMCQ